jgi:hypothetical protein
LESAWCGYREHTDHTENGLIFSFSGLRVVLFVVNASLLFNREDREDREERIPEKTFSSTSPAFVYFVLFAVNLHSMGDGKG